MASDSKLPAGENISKPMTAYFQMIESRVPSNTTPIDPAATLAQVIAELNQLKIDLNRQ